MSTSDSVGPRFYADALPASQATHRAAAGELFRGVLLACEIAVDFFACAFGMAVALGLQDLLRPGEALQGNLRLNEAICFTVALLAVVFLCRDGAYRAGSSPLRIRETERALRAAVLAVTVALPLGMLFGLQSALGLFLTVFALVPILLVVSRHAGSAASSGLCRKTRVVIYGAGDHAAHFVSCLSDARGIGLRPVLVVDEDHTMERDFVVPMGCRQDRSVRARCGPVTPAMLQSCQCGTLIVALSHLSPAAVDTAIEAARQAGVEVALLYGAETQWRKLAETADLDGFSLAPFPRSNERRIYAAVKRALDLIAASLLLALLFPLLLLIAALVKLDSPGPAIFSQERVGLRGQLFRMYKFRSMRASAPVYDFSPVTASDPRITRTGRLLRRTSLDELPQLANVLLGHMSLVGPRPEMPFITRDYTEKQRERLEVIPGITGLWQLSAARAFPIHENLHYDLYYIHNRAFFMDAAILLHTALFALRGGV